MPRKPRQQLDGPSHHIIIKGHNGEPIVTSDRDRIELATSLATSLAALGIAAWAWALLTNHAHFFLVGSITDISSALQNALGPYAQHRNAALGRTGRIFNSRFWSRPVCDDVYGFALALYVLLNPLKAGIVRTVDELERYRWCSLGPTLEQVQGIIPVDAAGVLAFFGERPSESRQVMRARLDERVAEWREDCHMRTLPAIIRVVAARHGLPPETLTDGTRGRWFVEARRDIVLEAKVRGYSDTAIAHALGMNRSSVGRLVA